MRRILLFVLSVILVSSLSLNAQMKLKLTQDITGETPQSLINHDLESNLNLELLPEATAPGGIKDFVKGMFLLGLLADVSIPFGDEDTGFKHIAGTGFSGHVMANYLVAAQFILALRAGYIHFGTQTKEGDDGFGSYQYEDTYYQIPILLGAYYILTAGSAFKPYLGLAFGIFLQNYSFVWNMQYETFGPNNQEQSFSQEGDASSTGFGVVPSLGFYYIMGGVVLQFAVEYALIFSNLPEPETTSLEKFNFIAQEEEETDEKASYLSILLGVAFPLGN